MCRATAWPLTSSAHYASVFDQIAFIMDVSRHQQGFGRALKEAGVDATREVLSGHERRLPERPGSGTPQ
jgi:hypothetical protein